MTYSLGPLPDDPTHERVLIDVTDNPNGKGNQVMFCLDVVTVPDEGVQIRCDGPAWFLNQCRHHWPGEWPEVTYRGASSTADEQRQRREAEKAAGTYRPTLRELAWQEESAARRRKRNAKWMQQHRAANISKPALTPCAHCGEHFQPQRSTARFCSTRCRVAAHRHPRRSEPG